jgi:hypothetical protein
MTIQLSTSVRNALLDAIEVAVGTAAVLKIFTGSAPANPAAADSGTVLATLSLPSDWMSASSSGVKSKNGTWQDSSADNSGTAGHFRLYASDGTTCHLQGSVGTSSADMILDSVAFTSGQSFTVTAFQLTAPNA